jgi:5-(carboxyamino)imidazole ribonucleotide synthase
LNEVCLGILGDGQLARMLCEAGAKKGLKVWVLGSKPSAPAAEKASRFFSEDQAQEFYRGITHLTFENEFFDPKKLEASLTPRTQVFPNWRTILQLRDKWEQKALIQSLGLPTAAASLVPDLKTLSALKTPQVLKWSVGGYDGKGTFVFRKAADLAKAEAFFNEGLSRGARVYAEDFVPFRLELAILGCRAQSGSSYQFPLVQSVQENNICRSVSSLQLGEDLRKKLYSEAAAIVSKLQEHLKYVGLLAVELFLTADDRLLINELAPRVHNSGHYSLSAASPTQFEAHIECGLEGLLATATSSVVAPAFAMWNLLGPEDSRPQSLSNLELPPANFDIYWYGKMDVKPGRKMGHLSAAAKNAEEEAGLLRAMKEWEKELWRRNLK